MTERGKKLRETFLKKYGVEHPSQLLSVKEKIKKKREDGAYNDMIVNMKKTLLEKYGDENYNNLEEGKKTKLKKYGDENYNNREKMVKTNQERYGMNVSPNVIKSTTERSKSGEIGFNSEKYISFLKNNNVKNISQLTSVKNKKKENQIKLYLKKLFSGNRLKGMVKPTFSENEYKGAKYDTLYKFECCKCGNIFEDTLYSGNIPRCLICYPYDQFKSKIELDIIDFLKSAGLQYKQHDRSILNGEEIDILINDKNIGIECDGVIWHSELFGKKDKQYHLNKSKLAENKGISLMHIWDWEWLNKKDLIKSIILNKVNKSEKIHARKCEIKEITNTQKIKFVELNHIQGDDTSSIRIGLFFNNVLVSVMTFVKSRYDKNYEYEMSRYCNKINTSVVGGASKLLNYFITVYNPKSIVSYCDKRFFNGKVYVNIGMKFIGDTPPNYYYFNKNNCVPISRIKFQKHKLNNILKSFDPSLTEWENMQLNGYDRIWDCGNLKYIWENTILP